MNFNSPEFTLFFGSLLVIYAFVFRRPRARDWTLLTASYVFYMSWNWKYAGLIAFSTLLDYVIGRLLGPQEDPRIRKLLVIASVASNLGLLSLFKYFNFFVETGEQALSLFGLEVVWLRHELLLPVGISFYTFQTLSYTIDLYRRRIEAEPDLLKFSVYVSFFPQLVAGPIVRASDFLPQLRRTPNVTPERFNDGFALLFQGLFKKIVIADLLARLGVDAVFANPSAFSSVDLVFALYGYAFQIYNDFSGYSDIAIGTARILGFDLPQNFDRPYLAQNVRDFWTRWHISLSTWLRDYLYISLGGNRISALRTQANLLITMLLGGLWHGAALNFVAWGAYHGILLVLAGRGAERAPERRGLARLWRQVGCFHLVVFGWLLFRVRDWDHFVEYTRGALAGTGGTSLEPVYYALLALGVVTHVTPREWVTLGRVQIARQPLAVQGAVYAALLTMFVGLSLGAPAFIYFQF